MREPKDKRTKEYKQWKETYGLGDLVNDITDTLGIKKCSKCEERKKKWNNVSLFRKHKVARCLTDNQIVQYKDYKQNAVKGKWKQESLKLLIDLYAHAFAIQYHTKNFCVNCNGSGNTLQHIESQLDKLIEKQADDS
jgi:viroplasmin and RNaseH domain-containing protein